LLADYWCVELLFLHRSCCCIHNYDIFLIRNHARNSFPVHLVSRLRNFPVFIDQHIKGYGLETKHLLGPFLVFNAHEIVMNSLPLFVVVFFNNFPGTIEFVATNGNKLHVGVAIVVRRQALQLVQGGRTASATSRPKICTSRSGNQTKKGT
jgi:hypothetical protein